MNKEQLAKAVEKFGDATITYRSENSRKLKYNVCTLDFDNEYIKNKQNRAKETEDTLLMFCWDVDAHKLMKVDNVTSVTSPIPSSMLDGRHDK